MKSSPWCALSLALALVACSSSSGGVGGPTTVTGTIGGATIATTDSIAVTGSRTFSTTSNTVMVSATAYETAVVVTNQASTCGIVQKEGNPPGGTALTLVVVGAGPVGTGTYSVGTGSPAAIQYGAQNASCAVTADATAVSGSITFTTASSTEVAGTFDATFASGDKVSGSFDAPVCDATLANLTATLSGCSG